MSWWRWLAFGLTLAFALLAGVLVSWLVRRALNRLAERTENTWDDKLPGRLRGPLRLAAATAVVVLLLPELKLARQLASPTTQLARALFFVSIYWGLWRTIDVFAEALGASRWASTRPVWRAFVPLVGRIAKALVIVVMGIAVLSSMGYPVASLIAGLGVGGLAVALAAQKTVENLFGSLSIAVDQPFRPNDFVKIEDFVGTVEAIGLRSTRIRTLDRTIITLPNGKLADMRTETFTVRDRMRLHAVLNLVYGTTAEQVRKVIRGIEEVLRAHPKIWPDALPVRFRALGGYALEIEVMCWFQTPDWNEFTAIRSEILLSFMDVVEKAGTSFALPTQTLHVELDEPQPRARAS